MRRMVSAPLAFQQVDGGITAHHAHDGYSTRNARRSALSEGFVCLNKSLSKNTSRPMELRAERANYVKLQGVRQKSRP